MKRTLALAFAVPTFLAVSAVLAAPARADALDKNRIPADARWFAHLDLEALARSELYKALAEHGELDLKHELDDLHDVGFEELGIDPLRDLKSVSVFSVGATGEQTVVLLAGNEKIDGALEHLKQQPAYRTDSFEGHTLHAWGDEHSSWFAAVLRKEGTNERLVVQSDDKASLKRAFDVLEGRAPSLATAAKDPTTTAARRATPAPGSILFAVATTRLSELAEIEAASNVARLAEDLVLDVGEAKNELFATLAIDAKDAKEARQIQQVMQGAVALLSLAAGADDEGGGEEMKAMRDLVAGFRFDTDGSTMHVELRLPVGVLLDALRALDAGDDDHDDDDDEEK